MPIRPRRRVLIAVLTCAALALTGCGEDAAQQKRAKAEAAVEQVLDSWARGEAPDKFADPSQPIQANDPDWKAGLRLLSFLNVDTKPIEGKRDHTRHRVALSLQDRQGKKVEKEVTYGVQVGDRIVISREP